MPGTYTQLLAHAVFSTKHRKALIVPDMRDRLYAYMGGLVRSNKCVLYDIGGVEDHVHMYMRLRADTKICDLLRMVKSRSSAWVHRSFPRLRAFAWQEAYAAFSVSKSQEPRLKEYIARQVEHHKDEDFTTELIRLLTLHGIEFDERYVFD